MSARMERCQDCGGLGHVYVIKAVGAAHERCPKCGGEWVIGSGHSSGVCSKCMARVRLER